MLMDDTLELIDDEQELISEVLVPELSEIETSLLQNEQKIDLTSEVVNVNETAKNDVVETGAMEVEEKDPFLVTAHETTLRQELKKITKELNRRVKKYKITIEGRDRKIKEIAVMKETIERTKLHQKEDAGLIIEIKKQIQWLGRDKIKQ
eukprot:UN23515